MQVAVRFERFIRSLADSREQRICAQVWTRSTYQPRYHQQ